MRVKYNTRSTYIPLFPRQNSRFAVHLSTAIKKTAGHSGDGQHHPGSPIYSDTGYRLFLFCLLSACKDDLNPKNLRRQLRVLRNRQTESQATAQGE